MDNTEAAVRNCKTRQILRFYLVPSMRLAAYNSWCALPLLGVSINCALCALCLLWVAVGEGA